MVAFHKNYAEDLRIVTCMQALQRPTFTTKASKLIYQYVDRHGTAAPDTIREALDLPADRFRAEVDRLIAEQYLVEREGTLELAVDLGADKEYTTEGGPYTIRPARNADFDDLVDTIRAVTEAGTYVVAETIAEQLLYDETVTRHTTVDARVFFVAAVDETVIGWTHLDLPQVEKLHNTAQQTVGVRTPYRGYGIGSDLLQRGLEWAEANGYRKVYNSLPATNDAALDFLEARGWDTEAIRKDHYTIDDQLVDEVMLAYTFD